MRTQVVSRDGRSEIVLAGRFDFNAHREFREAVDQALLLTAPEIRVDLSGVDYLDSSALGMLLVLRDKAREAGKLVTLTGAHGTVRQVIDIANFGKLFTLV